jgi:4-hydroxybenzoate polyprenyltransferase
MAMDYTSVQTKTALSRLKFFLALSRTPHALLDLAAPALSALLWLGSFPPWEKIGLGLLTAFSGYMSVYALNDVVDYRGDREKMLRRGPRRVSNDLDSFLPLHPMACGTLSAREGFIWMSGWGLLALLGSFLLNPVCTGIFVTACFLEILYCRLLKITYLRGVLSGMVKNSGVLAAVFAVDPHPSPLFLVVLFAWFFFWEIGGQNIPNDWMDLQEDRELRAKTIPVRFGPRISMGIIFFSLCLAVLLSAAAYWVLPAGLSVVYPAAAILGGCFFLLLPAYRLTKTEAPPELSVLFNRASYYPLVMLFVTILSWTF